MSASQLTTTAVVLSSAALLAAVVAGYVFTRKRQSRQRKPVGKISEIRLYPIKSCPALVLSSAECTATGLKYKNVHDRLVYLDLIGSCVDQRYLYYELFTHFAEF